MRARVLWAALGFLFGLEAGMLLWRTPAILAAQAKLLQEETARVRDTCLNSLGWERQRHREIEEFHAGGGKK